MSRTERSLLEQFQFKGKWWLPGNPERAMFGTLMYDSGGRIRLEVMGTIGSEDPVDRVSRLATLSKWDVILGLSDEGAQCTLLTVHEISGPLFPSDAGRSTFVADRLYIGSHFTTEEEIAFESADVEFTYLEDWVRARAFNFNLETEKGKRVIEFPSEPVTLSDISVLSRQTHLALISGIKAKVSEGRWFEGRSRAWFHIKPDQPQAYEWYEDSLWTVGSLLTLCVGQAVYPRRITGNLSGGSTTSSPANPGIEIYLRLQEPHVLDEVSYASMPVPFFMIEKSAPAFFNLWFSLEEKIKAVIGLLLGTYYNPRMYVETQFLTLMQAFEILHRRLFGGAYVSKEEWEPNYQTLLTAIPKDLSDGHKAALKMRLRYAFEFSLRKRLELTLKGLEERTRELIKGGDEGFVDRCVETRNGLTHKGSGSLKTAGLEVLWKANRRLHALVTLLIWKELGLSEDSIVTEIFSRVRP